MHLSIVSSAKNLAKSSFSVAASAGFVAKLLPPDGLIFTPPKKYSCLTARLKPGCLTSPKAENSYFLRTDLGAGKVILMAQILLGLCIIVM